jgi:hypothetical protein
MKKGRFDPKEDLMKRHHHAMLCALLLSFVPGGASAQNFQPGAGKAMAVPALAAPSSIVEEHGELHRQLDEALASGGETAIRAKAVAELLLPHFKAEEAYALPPLGLLQAIVNDQPLPPERTRDAIQMARELQNHYRQMIDEHRQIQAGLLALASTARQEHKPRVVAFAEALMLHAQNEEQVLYPATLLVGKYLELRQAAGH